MAETKLILKKAGQVAVRMYGQGFGDCFLLAFQHEGVGQTAALKKPVYVVIDNGVFYRTPGEKKRMQAVVRSIKAATGGTLDLLVVTHEHQDHLSGFQLAREEWKTIAVKRIWLAWTEDANHPATKEYDHEKEALMLQVEHALQVAEKLGLQDALLMEELEQARALTEFGVGGKIKAPDKLSKSPDNVLDDLTDNPGKRFKAGSNTAREFCEPGHVRSVPQTAVDVYVLGPPTGEGRLLQDFDAAEVYPETEEAGPGVNLRGEESKSVIARRLELAAAAGRAERAGLGEALRLHLRAADDTSPFEDAGAPFNKSMCIPSAAAREEPFFCEHYFNARADRQIETDWMRGFGRLALQVDRVINNTSLVLAFRLPDGRVLLFPGDAQVGNWLSWHEIKRNDWRRPDGGEVAFRPMAAELLEKTAVYKVGHHGSHNATLKRLGLELMPEGVIALIPALHAFPQAHMGWNIPLPTVVTALERKSGGRLVFPYERMDAAVTNTEFEKKLKHETSKEKLPVMIKDGVKIEDEVPLWRQVRL